ncbi:MAG: hypothetical protein J7K87_03105 [Candidatus Aenigmarchaeota archaeon]|nr:hypothetical protein [Candidatus Aenigmarchaeota archaeon]
MLDTLKKILHHGKNTEPRKPIIEAGAPREDYHIPGPEDIRSLPAPNFNVGRDMNREVPRRNEYQVPREPRFEPTPEPPTMVRENNFRGPTNLDEVLDEILRRLDDIDRRLANLERSVSPPSRRY